jgi:hypothetical protein
VALLSGGRSIVGLPSKKLSGFSVNPVLADYMAEIFGSAPDVTVQSLERANGQPMGDSELGPLFFAEVEHGNRSLPELIRHLGMLLANFPNLNGVLGIKGEEAGDNKPNALILIEWRTEAVRHANLMLRNWSILDRIHTLMPEKIMRMSRLRFHSPPRVK